MELIEDKTNYKQFGLCLDFTIDYFYQGNIISQNGWKSFGGVTTIDNTAKAKRALWQP